MEEFQFASRLTEDEFRCAQRVVAKQRPAVFFFFAYIWPKIGYALGVVIAFAALMIQAATGKGGSIGVTVAGALVGSSLWLHYGTQHRISKHFRSAGFWHKMHVNADALGVSLDCETGTKSHVPWRALSKVLAKDSVLILLQTPERFGIVSLAELDQSHRRELINFANHRVGKPTGEFDNPSTSTHETDVNSR